MISLTPIPNRIQKRLFEKMKVLGRSSSFPNKSSNGALTHEKMATRSTFLRMTSGQTNAEVLMGGKLDGGRVMKGGYDGVYGPRSYKIGGKRGSVYGPDFSDEDFEDIGIDMGWGAAATGVAPDPYTGGLRVLGKSKNGAFGRPRPGVKSIDVSFKGGIKAMREATVSWSCWHYAELDILMPHFLAHGKTVMVEWGWVYDDTTLLNLPSFLMNDFVGNVFIHADAYNNYRNKVIDANGDFDMMVGVIKNFEYTTRDDGGFDCQTILSSVGVNVLDNTEKTPDLVNPSTIYDISLKEGPKELKEKLQNATGDESDSKVDNLIKLNTTVTFKAFLSEIDTYVTRELYNKNKDSKFEKEIQFKSANYLGIDEVEPDSSILYIKNKFIAARKGIASLYNIEASSAWEGLTTEGDVWVRWGWFEDNILSKFLSVTSEDTENPIITEFRSVERLLTPKGKDTGKYESTRIRNNERLETVNVNSYILPGQFFPIENRTIKDDKGEVLATLKGDADKLIQLYHLTKERENFKSFATESDTIETEVGTGEFEDIVVGTREKRIKGGATFWTKKDDVYETVDIIEQREIMEEVVQPIAKPGKYGYLRNMLINTKVIKEAFGVADSNATLDPLNIIEGIQQLFSILNQEFNFWNFDIIVDETDSHRVKIVDNSTTKVDFSKPISEQRSKVLDNGEVYTTDNDGNRGDQGVFYFPVWRNNSLVKRQNVTAKLPSSMQLAAMYGSNVDAIKEFGHHGSIFEPGGVIAGALTNDVKDKNKSGLDIAIKNFTTRGIGQRDGDSTKPITINGGDNSVYEFLKNENITARLAKTYKDKGIEVDNLIKEAETASQNKEIDELYDRSLPPPMPRFMDRTDWLLLFDPTSKLYENISDKVIKSTIRNFETIFGQKFVSKELVMKPDFVNSIKRAKTSFGKATTESLPVLVPLELELEIDGIGGIYPANSFHSAYLPKRYKNETVFQAMDVNHRLDSTGWTTTLRGIMRSTLARVFDKSLADHQKTALDNYKGKVKQEQILRDKKYQESFGSSYKKLGGRLESVTEVGTK